MDNEIKVLSAKYKILQYFPYTAGSIIDLPVKLKNQKASVIITKDKITLNKKIVSESQEVNDIVYLLLSAGFLYSIALQERIKGFFKVIYYIASALYANEVSVEAFAEVPTIYAKNKIETFKALEPILYPDIKTRDEMLRLSIDELYRILLRKLSPCKETIDQVILDIYTSKTKKSKLSSNSLKSKSSINKLHNQLFEIILVNDYYSRGNSKDIDEAVERIVDFIVSACERYVQEYHDFKFDVNHEKIQLIQQLTKFSEPIMKSAGDASITATKIYKHIVKLDTYAIELLRQIELSLKSSMDDYDFVYRWDLPSRDSKRFYRRYGIKIVSPYLEKESKYDLLLIIDTSGSISDSEYIKFINLVGNIIFSNSIEVSTAIMFSDNVKKVIENISSKQQLFNEIKERVGYGGTVFSSVLKYLKKNYPSLRNKIVIIFTDGYFFDEKVDLSILKTAEKVIFITTDKVPSYFYNLGNKLKVLKIEKNINSSNVIL